jgi:hypothetical protein
MGDRDHILTPAARALLTEIQTAGSAKTKGRIKAADELDRKGLIHRTKGTATLSSAGRWSFRQEAKHG